MFQGHTNVHFLPVFDGCLPCKIKYDYILKLETFTEDISYVLEKIGALKMSTTLKLNSTNRNNSTSMDSSRDFYMQYYKNIPPKLLNSVYKYVKNDLLLFHYKIPDSFKRAITAYKLQINKDKI